MTTLTMTKKWTAGTWRARDAAGWVALAAAPAFALMAWIAATDAPRIALCSSGSNIPPNDGMAWMYLVMCLFHMPPWLRLAFGRHPTPQN